jgi:hypothetical protein
MFATCHHARRLKPLVLGGQPLSRRDWRRALIATEIVFASDVFGAGWDWSIGPQAVRH